MLIVPGRGNRKCVGGGGWRHSEASTYQLGESRDTKKVVEKVSQKG